MLLCIYLNSIFMLIHRNLIMMIDINQNSVLHPHTNQINISIFSPIFRLTISFADPHCRVIKKMQWQIWSQFNTIYNSLITTWVKKPRFKSKFTWTSIYMQFNPDLNYAQKLYFHGKWQNHFNHKFASTFIICRNFIWMKNWIYITIF